MSPLPWELAIGAAVGWLGTTETFIHDTRYSMPLLLYLSVFGSGLIVHSREHIVDVSLCVLAPRAPAFRVVATGALVLVAIVNTLGASFGVGGSWTIKLPGAEPELLETPGIVTVHSNAGFLVAAPHRDGDVLALMRALRRNGVREITWLNLGSGEPPPGVTPDFSEAGLNSLALIANLDVPQEFPAASKLTARYATVGHGPMTPGEAPPCETLSDGTGVWIRLGNPNGPTAKNYCPSRHPAFY